MDSKQRTLLTVITEAALESTLLRDLDELGAPGYTVSDVRGKGSRGQRDATWAPLANIRIEVLCDADTARRLADTLANRYNAHYPMLIYLAGVALPGPAAPSPP